MSDTPRTDEVESGQSAQSMVEHARQLERELAASRDDAWIAVTDRLPESHVNVLAYYRNSFDKGRRIRAYYAPKHTLEDDGEYQGDSDYVEETDTYYYPEGWYECNEHEEVNWRVDEKVTHWMPLPAPPAAEMAEHYDFSNAERGKYKERYGASSAVPEVSVGLNELPAYIDGLLKRIADLERASMADKRDAVPEGYVLVPIEPTEAMYAAAEREWDGRMSARSAGVWQAMLAAMSAEKAK